MNIDACLAEILDGFVAVAQRTFAKGKSAQVIRNSALLSLAGRGLAQLDETAAPPIWMASSSLLDAAQSKEVGDPFPSALWAPVATGSINKPNMTTSLTLIINELSVSTRKSDPCWLLANENVVRDNTLLTLAGLGQAILRPHPMSGEMIWKAELELLCNSSVPGWQVSDSKHQDLDAAAFTVRLDQQLLDMFEDFRQSNEAVLSMPVCGVPWTLSILTCLSGMELEGGVIAYKDVDGVIAWKASPEMVEELLDEEACESDFSNSGLKNCTSSGG
jgi:hypothetical protein